MERCPASATPRWTSATEEFLRFFTPAPGDGRTIAADCEIDGIPPKEGERLWIFVGHGEPRPVGLEHPNEIVLDRKATGTSASGLGVHRCVVPTSPAPCCQVDAHGRCSTGCRTSPAIRPAPRTTRPSGSSRACSTRRHLHPGRRLGLVWTTLAPATGVRRAGTGAADHRTRDAAVISW